MPGRTVPAIEEYMAGLKDGKEETVVLACIKRKEFKTIIRIAGEVRWRPDMVRGRLAMGRRGGLYGLVDRKPPSSLGGRRPPSTGPPGVPVEGMQKLTH